MSDIDQMHDALSGLLDWVKEGCPEGGGYAVVEAEAALKGLRVVKKLTVTISQKEFATESDDYLRGFQAGVEAAQRGEGEQR